MGAHRWVCGAGCHGGLGHGQFGLAYTANHGASALVDPDARGHSGVGLMMLIQSRQPAWIEQAGRSVWGACPAAAWFVNRCGQCWRIVGIHAVRFALFGLAGGGTQRRAFAGCLDHGAVCCGQRSLARGGPLAWRWVRQRLGSLRVTGARASVALFSAVSPCGRCGWIWYTSPRLVPLRCSGLRQQRFQDRACRRATVRIDVRSRSAFFVW